MNDRKKVFVIMPFEDEFLEAYELLKRKFDQDYEFLNAGEIENQQSILQDIIEPLYSSDIVIADLTKLNPNVMYELGVSHALNKKTIVITKEDLSQLPFDLKSYRAKNYSTDFSSFDKLIDYLNRTMKGAIEGTIAFSNPVSDVMKTLGITTDSMLNEEQAESELREDTDDGFLDFLAEIEDSANLLTEDIIQMTKEMGELSEGLTDSSNEINRVNKQGGSGIAAFARKQTKKAAKYVDDFSSKLRDHNKKIESFWDKLEKSTLGLLENKYAVYGHNKQALIDYLKSLQSIQQAITKSNASVENMKKSADSIIGLERSMNQAVRFLQDDLSTYVNNTENISSSIDKILAKSKFVVGDIATD